MNIDIVLLAAAAAEPAAAAAEAQGGLPQFNPDSWPSQLFWLAVTFGVLYWIMASTVLPRLGGAIEERRDRIADDFDQAAEFKRQAEEAEAAYDAALADARAKAQAIAADKRVELDSEIAEMQADADAKAETAIAAAEERIAAMKTEAAAKVRDAAKETARDIVAALIDETPTEEAVSAAVETAQTAR